jgi:RNA ligase
MPSKNLVKSLWGAFHPATRYSFNELRAGLQNGVKNKTIYCKKDKWGLELYHYNFKNSFRDNWDLFSLIARGIILDPKTKKIVSLTFPKFFNHNEVKGIEELLKGEKVVAQEKLDGSLISVWYHPYENLWKCTTKGGLQSDVGKIAQAWFDQNVDEKIMDGSVLTYLFEFTSPENRVVVKYPYTGLTLLSGYYPDGSELSLDTARVLSKRMGVPVVKNFTFNGMEELLEQSKTIGIDMEGWVVRYANGHREKIKGDPYCRAHRIISGITPVRVWESLLHKDKMEELVSTIPEEFRQDYYNIKMILLEQITNLINEIEEKVEEIKGLEDREVGLKYKGYKHLGLLFFVRKNGGFKDIEEADSQIRRRVFKCVRPDGDALPGYSPSNAVNRFG